MRSSRKNRMAPSRQRTWKPQGQKASKARCSAGSRVESIPAVLCGDNTVRSKSFDVSHGWLAKEAAVFPVELADAFVADLVSCARGVHPVHKHPLLARPRLALRHFTSRLPVCGSEWTQIWISALLNGTAACDKCLSSSGVSNNIALR